MTVRTTPDSAGSVRTKSDGQSGTTQGGHDAGDHPPITPVASATEAELGGGDDWRLYDYIARHFLGSLSGDCIFRRTIISFATGGERFSASGVAPARAGFTAVMPWKVLLLVLTAYCSKVMASYKLQQELIVVEVLEPPQLVSPEEPLSTFLCL